MIVFRALSLLLLVLICVVPGAARADDISATARGVVRVVTIAMDGDQVVGFGHGSGFAVAPNRIVTNAHVVELAERFPDNVVIGVVPSEGAKSYQGRVIAYDARRDLALIEFTGGRLPPAALYTGPVTEGDRVVALGYPGNVDLATAQSAADYIRPTSPVRTEGGFSARRALSGTDVLLHTAGIARGNSGGPLLDGCGRVIGVNSAITRGEEGDSSFGFAIADNELATFLRAADQAYASVGLPCTSIEDRLRQDTDADARVAADAITAQREAAAARATALESERAKAREATERDRENFMALAGLLLVGGALAIGAAGLFESRGERRRAIWCVTGGGVAVVAAVLVFVFRPSGAETPPIGTSSATTGMIQMPVAADQALGPLVCKLVPERSRVTISSTADVPMTWGKGGCMNGRTQYVPANGRWEKILVPDEEQTVSVLGFDPATQMYTNTRYLMSAAAMEAARAARAEVPAKACTADPAATAKAGERNAAIRVTLPPLPNEKLVYRCAAR